MLTAQEFTDAAQRMSQMVTGLLTYSSAAHRRETRDRVDLNDSLAWAMKNLALAMEESSSVVEAAALPTIQGNSVQLAQVFQNLIGNAIKYRRPDVAPVIAVRYVRGSAEHLITIADNGTGIPADCQDRVFRLFERAHGREYSGTGVGLAVCKRIIENHGGRIWVESTFGSGSQFHFTFPDNGPADSVS